MPEVETDRPAQRAILTWIYGIVGGGLVTQGIYYLFSGLWETEGLFSGVGAMYGFAIALVGVVNLLSLSYGYTSIGVRGAAIGANLVLLGLELRQFGDMFSDWAGRLLFISLIIVAALSVTERALSRKGVRR